MTEDPVTGPSGGGPPPAEVDIDDALVHDLVQAQHPDLGDLPLRPVAEGWDNVTYRLGDDLAVRLPRRQVGVGLLVEEQRWLPRLDGRLPVAIPVPVRRGRPAGRYPWPWSIVRWVHGIPTDEEPLGPAAAGAFGRFLAVLHGSPVTGLPVNPHRGGRLGDKEPALGPRWERLTSLDVDVVRARRRWDEVVTVPADVEPVWLHGDLHPGNVVGDGGRLAGVIDWGDLGSGDPATDLAAAWMHFPPDVHGDLWAAYGTAGDATRARAEGWALFFAVLLLDTDPEGTGSFGRIGRTTLERLTT